MKMKKGERIVIETLEAGPNGVREIGTILEVGKHISVKDATAKVKHGYANEYTGKKNPKKKERTIESTEESTSNVDLLDEAGVKGLKTKAELLAACASAQFDIDPNKHYPERPATNAQLKELLLNALKPSEETVDETTGDDDPETPEETVDETTGDDDPETPEETKDETPEDIKRRLSLMEPAALLGICADPDYNITPPDGATAAELVELIMAKMAE